MPPPRFCSSPRVRSSTVTSQPQRESAIAAAQPAMLPPRRLRCFLESRSSVAQAVTHGREVCRTADESDAALTLPRWARCLPPDAKAEPPPRRV